MIDSAYPVGVGDRVFRPLGLRWIIEFDPRHTRAEHRPVCCRGQPEHRARIRDDVCDPLGRIHRIHRHIRRARLRDRPDGEYGFDTARDTDRDHVTRAHPALDEFARQPRRQLVQFAIGQLSGIGRIARGVEPDGDGVGGGHSGREQIPEEQTDSATTTSCGTTIPCHFRYYTSHLLRATAGPVDNSKRDFRNFFAEVGMTSAVDVTVVTAISRSSRARNRRRARRETRASGQSPYRRPRAPGRPPARG